MREPCRHMRLSALIARNRPKWEGSKDGEDGALPRSEDYLRKGRVSA